ncbi:MAG TPA: hypothetical protein VHX15_17145 [Frankiaceae bacterium]|jgi:hypothetical protein|nr:hypothetical protein [Frankiaceae bacterium]
MTSWLRFRSSIPRRLLTDLFGLQCLEQDGVAPLHDVEAEAGDEQGLWDEFELDHRAARQIGVELDLAEDEPRLD